MWFAGANAGIHVAYPAGVFVCVVQRTQLMLLESETPWGPFSVFYRDDDWSGWDGSTGGVSTSMREWVIQPCDSAEFTWYCLMQRLCERLHPSDATRMDWRQ